MIILPDDYRFTLSEVVGESSVDATNLRNWMSRDVLSVGQKHKLGRWLFSIADIIRIRVVKSLTTIAMMPPADANGLANIVVQHYRDLVTVDEKGRYPLLYKLKANSVAGRKRLMLTAGRDGPFAQVGTFNPSGVLEFPTGYEDRKWSFDEMTGGNPYLMIPMDEIIARAVMDYTIRAMEEEGQEWKTPPFEGDPKDGQYDPFAAMVSVEGMLDWYSRNPPPPQTAAEVLRSGGLRAVVADVARAVGDDRNED